MTSFIQEEFGNRLRVLRKRIPLTQEELAEKLNIEPKTYSNYETGRRSPDLRTVVCLAHLLNTTTDYLLMGKENDTEPADCLMQKLDSVLSIVSMTANKLGVQIGD